VILATRALLLLVVASAVVIACVVSWRRAPNAGSGLYTCAMHPEITAPGPGQCPICRMALEPARARAAGGAAAAGSPPEAGSERFTISSLPHDRLFADVMFVRPRPMARTIVAPAWADSAGTVTASLYHDELAMLAPAEEGLFQATGGTSTTAVRLEPVAPTFWDADTSRVRLRAARPPAAGTARVVTFAARTRSMLAVPSSAVVQGPAGPYVLVASLDRHTFTRRPVAIGRVLFGYAPVLSGLISGERVAVMETFFIDAERRLGAQLRRNAGQGAP
jgi:hypothetical protein